MPSGTSPPRVRRAGNIGARIAAFPRLAPAVLLALLVWEVFILPSAAGRTYFWYDEVLTLRISGLDTFSRVWQALYDGADGMPPLYYVFVRAARILPVAPELALRLPSVAGYLLTLVSVFWFTRRRLTAAAALTAVLLVALSPIRAFALEARSYALLVGVLSLAAVFWQNVGHRRYAAAGLGLCLSIGVASHYLAVIAIGLFAGAELSWTLWNHRVRRGVWAACVCAAIPFLVNLPIALRFRSIFGRHFWSLPQWSTVVTTYRLYLPGDYNPALLLCLAAVVMMLAALPGMWKRHRAGQAEDGFPLPDLVLVAGFLLYPATLAVAARLTGAGYVPRYGLPVVFGLAVAAIYGIRFLWRHPHSVVLPGALLLLFSARCVLELGWLLSAPPASPGRTFAELLEGNQGWSDLPIVVTPGAVYLVVYEYAPRAIRDRMVYLIDPEEAIRYSGTDTVDLANRILARYVSLHIEQRAAFLAAHARFLVASSKDPHDWLTPYLNGKGYAVRPLSRHHNLDLSLVEH